MSALTTDLDLKVPVIAAPMAGGASTPALVAAASRAGGLGFLAAGYKTPQALSDQIDTVRAEGVSFGVNVFAPNPVPVDVDAYRAYARAIQVEADRYDITLADGEPVEDDDYFSDKIDLLLASPVPVVSFTFGFPTPGVIKALRIAGSLVVLTVTSEAEALLAVDAGADLLVVQSSAAGGHSGTLTPLQVPAETPITELIAQIRHRTSVPLLAAGGLATSADVAAALRAGAEAAVVGTVLLRTEESGASAPHKAALAETSRGSTVVTRAFTGRPARALRNEFTDRYDAQAPIGYPAIHHLTNPMRKAAVAQADPERMHLWAGTGYRHATEEPAGVVLSRLANL
ncbi:nitronate monooxygenase [Rhodococcus sp. IEGM 1241]|uniref:NAD(P)H-dependent flavin oxidoreductase n=1 Tax=Rhodococcus sp. IEGM 1241 TaxID=3082228 RepID=UPI002953AE9C|nr:nitronate monooxygenase [Rhodococcus sp. IEGM 1241]MDV8009835.1 nitronate monooxygenase [Rhodococcus sp. IEGM 1241]